MATLTTTTDPRRSFHLGYLDGLRGLAAVYVMLHHSWLTVYNGNRYPTRIQALLEGWLHYGHFAVDLFIVLSGFSLMIPVLRKGNLLEGGASAFYRRRIRRILPPYYAALLLAILLAKTVISHKTGTVWDFSLPVTKMGILAHLLLLQNIHRALEINSVFWSIAVECQIYLLFPILVLGWKNFGVLRTAAVAITLSLIACVLLEPTRWHGLTAHYVALFTFGMLGSTICFSDTPEIRKFCTTVPWRIIALTTFIAIVVWTQTGSMYGFFGSGLDVLVGLCSVAFIIALNEHKGWWMHRMLNLKPIVYVGTMSYSLYLVHLPLLQLIWQYVLASAHLTNQERLLSLAVGGLTVVLFASWLFHLAFERPFMSTLKVRPVEQPPTNTVVTLTAVQEP